MNDSFVDGKVGNVFVKGYYYGILNKIISSRTSFEEYLHNYYDPSLPTKFINEAIKITFPDGIKVINPTTLLTESIPENQMLALSNELLKSIQKHKKSEYRSVSENKELAET